MNVAYYNPSMIQQPVNSNTKYSFHNPEPNNIVCIAGGTEMLKVGPDGFWVRGVKVKQDDNEAEIVYNAFKSFLMWSELNRK